MIAYRIIAAFFVLSFSACGMPDMSGMGSCPEPEFGEIRFSDRRDGLECDRVVAMVRLVKRFLRATETYSESDWEMVRTNWVVIVEPTMSFPSRDAWHSQCSGFTGSGFVQVDASFFSLAHELIHARDVQRGDPFTGTHARWDVTGQNGLSNFWSVATLNLPYTNDYTKHCPIYAPTGRQIGQLRESGFDVDVWESRRAWMEEKYCR